MESNWQIKPIYDNPALQESYHVHIESSASTTTHALTPIQQVGRTVLQRGGHLISCMTKPTGVFLIWHQGIIPVAQNF